MNKISNIKMILGLGAAVLLTSCAASKSSVKTLNEIAREQAQQDSLFYRNIFNQTQAAKDSMAVEEFNRIAARMKNINQTKRRDISREILQNAINNGADKYDIGLLRGVQYISKEDAVKLKQQLADKSVYEKFLQEIEQKK